MGATKREIHSRRPRKPVVEARKPLRLHPRPAHRNGYQELAKADAASVLVSSETPQSLALTPLILTAVPSHLKPGAWIELQEAHHRPQCHDNSILADHPVVEFWDNVTAGLAALGVNFNATLDLADMLRAAGFVNVTTRIFHVLIGPWPKNKVLKLVGLYWRTVLLDGVQPIALGPMTRGLGWTKDEVEVWLVGVRKAYMQGGIHSHMPLHIICGQKPEEVGS
jgi:hypothetical protein